MFCTLKELLNHVFVDHRGIQEGTFAAFLQTYHPTQILPFLFTLFEFLSDTSAVHEI